MSITVYQPSLRHPPKADLRARDAGFTIIEIMVTVTVLGLILAIGLPNLREFMTRNQAGAITAEFTNDLSRARTEAISRNNCVTMCMSANTANALTGGTPTCATSGLDWQAGWIIFSNPSCSATQDDPTTVGSTLISVRQPGVDSFTLQSPTATPLRRFIFDSRGLSTGIQSTFTLAYTQEATGGPNHRLICISSAGKVSVKKYGGSTCP